MNNIAITPEIDAAQPPQGGDQQSVISTAPQQEPDRSPASTPVAPVEGTPSEAPPETGNDAWRAGQAAKAITPDTVSWVNAVLEKVSHASPMGLPGYEQDDPGWMTRYLNERGIEERDRQQGVMKISADEANKKYLVPGMTPFNEPVDPYVAQIRADGFKHQKAVDAWKDSGGTAPWTEMGIGMVAGLTDPVNIMAMSLMGPATKVLGIGESALTSLAENAAFNFGMGVPAYYQEKNEGNPVSLGSTLQQAAIGTLAMTGLRSASIALLKGFGAAIEDIKKMPWDVQEANMKQAVSQAESGAKISMTDGSVESAARRSGEINGATSTYRFQPQDHPSQGAMYAARSGDGTPANLHGLDLGPGQSVVDNGQIANNHVSNPGGEKQGQVGRFDINPEDKYLNIEQPADSPEVKQFASQVEEKLGVNLDIQEGESIKDVLKRIGDMAKNGESPEDSLSQVQEIAKGEGYVGYHGVEETPNGGKVNFAHIFDENAQPSQAYQSNPEITPTQTPEQKMAQNQEMRQPESSATYTPEIEKQLHDLKHGESIGSDPDEIMQNNQEKYDSARAQLDQIAKDNPELAKEINETLDRENATDKQEKSVLEKFAGCMRGTS